MKNIFYDKSKIDYGNLLFPRRALWMLLIPLIIEQMLNSLMGMVDTLMVSRVGAEAISAVSLVDSINNLVLQVFAAMAAGAAIICSQYLGRKDEKGCNDAAKQIVLTVVVISSVIMIIGVGFRKPLLHLIFGSVEEAVMTNAQIYFLITALSYPFIALFQAGAAFYRACGNSKFTMKTALIANVANIVGNTLFIFVLQMGAAGAAVSTLISRALCAFVVFYALRKPGYAIQLKNYFSIRPDLNLIVKILAIGVPRYRKWNVPVWKTCNSVYSIITWNSSNRSTGDDNHFRKCKWNGSSRNRYWINDGCWPKHWCRTAGRGKILHSEACRLCRGCDDYKLYSCVYCGAAGYCTGRHE